MLTRYRRELIAAVLLAAFYVLATVVAGSPQPQDPSWHHTRLRAAVNRLGAERPQPTPAVSTPSSATSSEAGSAAPTIDAVAARPATPPAPDAGVRIRRFMVDACYDIVTLAYILMIIQGLRTRSYGMPLVGCVVTLGVCFLCSFVGPWSSEFSFLFFDAIKRPYRITTWRLWFVLQSILFIQYLLYSEEEHVPEMARFVAPQAWFLLLAVTVLEWYYIIFYQDFYVNEICIVGLFVTAVSYVHAVLTRRDVRGLSVVLGAMLTIGNTLLFVAMLWGGLEGPRSPYPYKYFGHDFIRVLLPVTIAFFCGYVLLLARRRPLRETRGLLDWLLVDLGLRRPSSATAAPGRSS